MLKEFVEFLKKEFKATEFHEVNGQKYTNDPDLQVLREPVRDGLHVASLSGLVDFIRDNFDGDERLLITVRDEEMVMVETRLNNNSQREKVMVAIADVPEKTLNRFMDLESFNIQLQSQFVPTDDSRDILRIIGNLRSENVKNIGDDGITQKVEVKQGVTIANDEVVPNPVYLKPFRSFTEIAQPESPFVFRLKNVGDSMQAALFEADGGAWKNEARISIKEYLKDYLAEEVGTEKVLIIG